MELEVSHFELQTLTKNFYEPWSNMIFRKNQLSCSGGSFYGMIIGNKIDFYLTEIYNFSGMFKSPWAS